jgi:hypothetical protein
MPALTIIRSQDMISSHPATKMSQSSGENAESCELSSASLLTTELLILVLSHVDIRTLLLAQRVSRGFKELIADSPTLQRRLFFLGAPHQTVQPAEPVTYEEGVEPRYIRHVALNPLLVHSFPSFFPKSDSINGSREHFSRLDWARNAERSAAYARPEASWRRMLLSDPLPEATTLVWSTSYMHGGRRRRVELPRRGDGNGVMMGLLYDLVQDLVIEKGRFCNGSFYLGWNFAEAYIEEEWIWEQANWDPEHRIVALEGKEFILEVKVEHFFGCLASVGSVLSGFRSDAPDVVDFETFEQQQQT